MLIESQKRKELIEKHPKLKVEGKSSLFMKYKLKYMMINACMGKLSIEKS